MVIYHSQILNASLSLSLSLSLPVLFFLSLFSYFIPVSPNIAFFFFLFQFLSHLKWKSLSFSVLLMPHKKMQKCSQLSVTVFMTVLMWTDHSERERETEKKGVTPIELNWIAEFKERFVKHLSSISNRHKWKESGTVISLRLVCVFVCWRLLMSNSCMSVSDMNVCYAFHTLWCLVWCF